MKKLVIVAIAVTSISISSASPIRYSDEAAQNLGSSLAYAVLCERAKYIESGSAVSTVLLTQESFPEEAWVKVKREYQRGLHNKMHYSIAKNEWFPFIVQQAQCRSIEQSLPTLKAYLKGIQSRGL